MVNQVQRLVLRVPAAWKPAGAFASLRLLRSCYSPSKPRASLKHELVLWLRRKLVDNRHRLCVDGAAVRRFDKLHRHCCFHRSLEAVAALACPCY